MYMRCVRNKLAVSSLFARLLRWLDAVVGNYCDRKNIAIKKCIADALFLSGSWASCFSSYALKLAGRCVPVFECNFRIVSYRTTSKPSLRRWLRTCVLRLHWSLTSRIVTRRVIVALLFGSENTEKPAFLSSSNAAGNPKASVRVSSLSNLNIVS